ncbi:DUF4238 domain-containing protein [Rhizobium leguminosarum]|uniref:DUF4238 domain-containing protein n=1 Tax=Rhizobium leguminosarum TaxID=384 RepID=UPI001C9684E8|nr:DUF4238 domain-containing protein [Rhizobium leguminosarum]MBY5616072.1 DUF4238 domain-containing protein [Rhizobium leguminosarum]
MPALKNQHFVPKVHLRAFAPDDGKKMVNMLHAASMRAIKGASLSGQCAKHYFYGKDLVLEKQIGEIEGQYAELVRELEGGHRNGPLLETVKTLAFFQHFRTDAVRTRFLITQRQLFEATGEIVDEGKLPFSDEDLIQTALAMFFTSIKYIGDLKTCVLLNHSRQDFVTSDDPAVLFNKFILQKTGAANFGLMNSGICLYMPITPRMAVLCYDENVYRIAQNEKSEVIVRKRPDVIALNSLVMLNNANCVYFRNWDERDDLLAHLRDALPLRSPGTRTHRLVPVDGKEGAFRPLKAGEEYNGAVEMFHSEAVYPRPIHWMSFLDRRLRPVTYFENTAAGYVRKEAWLRSGPDGL